jgi:hypothetical protein
MLQARWQRAETCQTARAGWDTRVDQVVGDGRSGVEGKQEGLPSRKSARPESHIFAVRTALRARLSSDGSQFTETVGMQDDPETTAVARLPDAGAGCKSQQLSRSSQSDRPDVHTPGAPPAFGRSEGGGE